MDLTPVILTYNEAPNIARVLARLTWATEVVVIDSGSTDSTLQLLASFANVRVVHRLFDSHAQQWSFAVHETGIATRWILALDADYLLTPELQAELPALLACEEVAGYRIPFRYCVQGQPLRGTLYPPVVALYQRAGARYVQDGHTQRLQLDGDIRDCSAFMLHDDRKPLSHWLWAQDRYARLEADLLLTTPWRELRLPDRLRTIPMLAPIVVFFYCLLAKRGILDGRAGLFYAMHRLTAELIIQLKFFERRWLGAQP